MMEAILESAGALGFTQSSDALTGSLLETLAASKPGGRFLELGTGVGAGSARLLSGMDAASRLITVERNAKQVELAKKHLGSDSRITFWVGDGLEFLQQPHTLFDLIFADTWPGKISRPELALNLVAPGGFYVVDDMELGWKDETDLEPPLSDYLLEVWRGQRALVELLEIRNDFHCTRLDWSTGLLVCVKKGA
jgi:predicted O-methyltransferase YrrM